MCLYCMFGKWLMKRTLKEWKRRREGSVLHCHSVRKVALIYHVEPTRASIA